MAPCRRDKLKEERTSDDLREPDETRLRQADAILHGFPSSVNLFVPPGIPCHKLDTFLSMYKTHCRNLLRAVAGTTYDDVPLHLNSFWNEIPDYISPILDNEFVANVIETCDILFFEVRNFSFICVPLNNPSLQAMEVILVPHNLDKIADSVIRSLEAMQEKVPVWLHAATRSLAPCICSAKTRGKVKTK